MMKSLSRSTCPNRTPNRLRSHSAFERTREYLKLNQAQVAEVLGIPRAAVSALETGRRRVSGLELKKLAALFGTSGDRLLGHEVDDDPTAVALFRTAKALTDDDRLQVLRFAEFLRGAGPAPAVDFDAEP